MPQRFNSIPLAPSSNGGLTKEAVYAQMKATFHDKFDFECR